MSTNFLFINEDETSFPIRPKRPLTSVRSHVRLQHGRNAAQQKSLDLRKRALPPKALQACTSKANEAFTVRACIKPAKGVGNGHTENLPKLPLYLTSLLTFKISPRIYQRYPDASRLIIFYLSGEGSEVHSSLRCTTQWSNMIIQKGLESECHTLFLLCYISSIVLYLENLAKIGRVRQDSRHSSLSSESSSLDYCFSPRAEDWEIAYLSEPRNASHHSPVPSSSSPALKQPPISILPRLCQTSQLSPVLRVPSIDQYQPSSHTSLNTPSYTLPSDPMHLTHQAVATLKSRLSTKLRSVPPPPLSEFLFPVWCLFRSAILQSDEFAAVSHERFLRHLLYKADGAIGVPPWLLRIIVEVDLKLGVLQQKDDIGGKSNSEAILESERTERGEQLCDINSREKT